jgi:5-formyltetrahydrofolate cyclo-ligase
VKQALRKAARARRAAFVASLPAETLAHLTRAANGHVIDRLGDSRVVAGYVAMGGEIDPLGALVEATARGVAVALPRIEDPAGPMRFLRWTPGEFLEAGPLGVRQPAADAAEIRPDLILTPLVAFDRALARLGQGAAFYDRAFAVLPEARRIGLAWAVQEVDGLPTEAWDIPLHAIATEQEWICSPPK